MRSQFPLNISNESANDHIARCAFHRMQIGFDIVLLNVVIAVYKKDIPAFCMADAPLSCSAQADVGFVV